MLYEGGRSREIFLRASATLSWSWPDRQQFLLQQAAQMMATRIRRVSRTAWITTSSHLLLDSSSPSFSCLCLSITSQRRLRSRVLASLSSTLLSSISGLSPGTCSTL